MNKWIIIGGVAFAAIVIYVVMKSRKKTTTTAGTATVPTTAPATGPESQAFISAGGAGSSAYGSAATA